MVNRQEQVTTTSSAFNNLFLKHVTASYEKQLCLSQVIKNKSWAFDKESGLLTFGTGADALSFKVQVLGTESEISHTWVWAWGNKASNIPEDQIVDCSKLKQLGARNGIKELTERKLECNEKVNGHTLSMVASGVCGANAYYRGPYEGGAVFLLIKDPKYPVDSSSIGNAIRIAQNFTQVICNIEINNHRIASRAYFEYHKGTIKEANDSIIATFSNGESITANFFNNDMLENLSTTIRGKEEDT